MNLKKLARDVYTTLVTQWDLKAFHNIVRADQVDTLIAAYGLTDPAINEIGRFQNALLQHRFDRAGRGFQLVRPGCRYPSGQYFGPRSDRVRGKPSYFIPWRTNP